MSRSRTDIASHASRSFAVSNPAIHQTGGRASWLPLSVQLPQFIFAGIKKCGAYSEVRRTEGFASEFSLKCVIVSDDFPALAEAGKDTFYAFGSFVSPRMDGRPEKL